MDPAAGLILHLTAIYSQLSVSRAVLVSVLVVLLAAAAHCILGTTAGAGTLTLTIPALSSLTQTQILYLTAGGLSTDTLTIYTVSTYIHPCLGLAAAGGLGALAVASSVLADGGGGGASGGYGYSAPAREGHSGVQD